MCKGWREPGEINSFLHGPRKTQSNLEAKNLPDGQVESGLPRHARVPKHTRATSCESQHPDLLNILI